MDGVQIRQEGWDIQDALRCGIYDDPWDGARPRDWLSLTSFYNTRAFEIEDVKYSLHSGPLACCMVCIKNPEGNYLHYPSDSEYLSFFMVQLRKLTERARCQQATKTGGFTGHSS